MIFVKRFKILKSVVLFTNYHGVEVLKGFFEKYGVPITDVKYPYCICDAYKDEKHERCFNKLAKVDTWCSQDGDVEGIIEFDDGLLKGKITVFNSSYRSRDMKFTVWFETDKLEALEFFKRDINVKFERLLERKLMVQESKERVRRKKLIEREMLKNV